MYDVPEIFIFIGVLAIIWQLGSDFIKLKIDERKNWVMQGMIISLVLITSTYIPYIIAVFSTYCLMKLLTKFEQKHGIGFAEGDKQIIQWIIPGLVLLSTLAEHSVIFIIILFVQIIGLVFFAFITKKSMKLPGLTFITISFFLTIYFYYFIPLA
jgi:uncharacterized membrane protein AbrB (regulator of aidB expression)